MSPSNGPSTGAHALGNDQAAPKVYIGSDKTLTTLRLANITRIFYFHERVRIVDVLSDGTFREVEDFGKNEYNYLKLFPDLCWAIHQRIGNKEGVLLYLHTPSDECDTSRAYTLEEAWRIWERAQKNNNNARQRDIVKHHQEQLRVWAAMVESNQIQRDEIYEAWKEDMVKGERWRGRGLSKTGKVAQQVRRRM